jgi:hypothetical protein
MRGGEGNPHALLLANLLQGSRSTFSYASFPRFFAFKEGIWDTPISALLSSPTVSGHFSWPIAGLDHGVGHSLLLLYDVKAPNGQKEQGIQGLRPLSL